MKKGDALAILATPKGGGEEREESPPSSSEHESEEVDAARDLIDAIEAKDPKAVHLAYARMYELCAQQHEDDESPESGRY